MTPDAFIYDAVRTPRGRGKKTGSLYTVAPVRLLAGVLDAVQTRNSLAEDVVDDVIVGCVTQTSEQGSCIARAAVLLTGLGDRPPGQTVNRFCGSGLETVNQAAALVASGFSDLVIAGGVESMSRVKMGSDGGALFDPVLVQGRGIVPQGISADLLAGLNGIDRLAVDTFALESQQRAIAALDAGRFARSVIPVTDENGLPILEVDELPRRDTSAEALGKLNPAFQMLGEQFGLDQLTRKAYPHVDRIEHIHHAGNSSGIVDGAAAVLVGNARAGERHGLSARAHIRSVAVVGAEPVLMLQAPMPAAELALQKAGMSIEDIDLFEVNEAFAAVPLAFMKHFDLSRDKVNVNGGAIALGHPLGATGAMLLGTALDALEEHGLSTALVTLCIGGGMGIATIIERV
ncbi:MAG: acetyl-CoA C-acetyltransferase [Proteobacteria bacterium]|nr:acetyl-CoA C-acetyltransferase [Pseudomonadota bacterium]MCP4916592.1 acetyl-CoA C-acetyltransferase [Pseudomonadota bacterium]